MSVHKNQSTFQNTDWLLVPHFDALTWQKRRLLNLKSSLVPIRINENVKFMLLLRNFLANAYEQIPSHSNMHCLVETKVFSLKL